MRKKISMFALFLTMAISLSACGGPSKESLLKNAITADPNFMQDIVDGAKANEAKLVKDFKGKAVLYDGVIVANISSSGTVTLGLSQVKTSFVLPEEDLLTFEEKDVISVVGTISEITVLKKSADISGSDIRITLDPAYLVDVGGPSFLK